MTVTLETRLRVAVAELPDGLRAHIERVEAEAARLARLHGVDEDRARLAALGHDLVRHKGGAELLELATAYGLTPDEVERASPILVHGPVAAAMLLQDYGVEDADLVLGVDCHTTARAGMTALENVLFVADKVEPHKLMRDAALSEVKDLAEGDLDAGVLRYLDHYLDEAVRRGWRVHPRSVEARAELSARFRREG
ncbi:MAG TPA: bis(5'-nucleosyl)-tetraphosphatase (symmetrical) YqeK [Dehalococcoidia bacterium]|nr:bis(5'-nucleosyl)-tetraphosphatase (symmetrical) YqeK [Dehalococcoidia bacterium]